MIFPFILFYPEDRVIQVRCTNAINKEIKAILSSFPEFLPGPLNMALIVPDVKACSLFTMNSWPSEEINFTYMASGPSQPP